MIPLFVAVVVIAVIVLFIGLAYSVSTKLLKPPRRIGKWNPRDLGYDYEELSISVGDIVLKGWLIPRGSNKTVIAIHGYTSSKYDEGYMKPIIKMLADNGFNVVALDLRGHGDSGGEYTTLGYLEEDDMVEVIDWLVENKGGLVESIGVIGYSMGGAVAIMLAARDKRVKAVVADSPYMDIIASGRRWVKRLREPLRSILLALYPLIVYFTKKRSGVDTEALKIHRYADKISQPILLICGRNDDLVYVDEIEKFYDFVKKYSREASIWVTGSRHVSSINDYPSEYESKVIGFFKRWL